MTSALVLACYVVGTGFLAPPMLVRSWSQRSPRLAIVLWLALPASCVAAAVLAGVALASPMSMTPQWAKAGSMMAYRHSQPGTIAFAVAGLMIAATVLVRTAGCLASVLVRARRDRRQHSEFVAAIGRADESLGAVVLDDDTPAAYCMPSGGHRVVVSTGTLEALTPVQLRAVLAHERAHLRSRHHAVRAWAWALARAFPFVPLISEASAQLALLAEMAADDAAARRHDPCDLAAALVILAKARARAQALTAGGPAAVARIHRLLSPPVRPARPVRAARVAAGIAALVFPAVIAALPLLLAACAVQH